MHTKIIKLIQAGCYIQHLKHVKSLKMMRDYPSLSPSKQWDIKTTLYSLLNCASDAEPEEIARDLMQPTRLHQIIESERNKDMKGEVSRFAELAKDQDLISHNTAKFLRKDPHGGSTKKNRLYDNEIITEISKALNPYGYLYYPIERGYLFSKSFANHEQICVIHEDWTDRRTDQVFGFYCPSDDRVLIRDAPIHRFFYMMEALSESERDHAEHYSQASENYWSLTNEIGRDTLLNLFREFTLRHELRHKKQINDNADRFDYLFNVKFNWHIELEADLAIIDFIDEFEGEEAERVSQAALLYAEAFTPDTPYAPALALILRGLVDRPTIEKALISDFDKAENEKSNERSKQKMLSSRRKLSQWIRQHQLKPWCNQ